MIDGRGRLFGKISVIDVLIVIVLVVAVAVVGYRFTKLQAAGPFPAKQDRLRVVFYQEEVNDFTAKTVKKGDPAKDALLNVSFGQVVDVKTDKSVSIVKSDKGEYHVSSKEGYCSVYITMETNGSVGNSGATIGNSVYYIGQTITLHAGNAVFFGKIFDFQKVSAGEGE